MASTSFFLSRTLAIALLGAGLTPAFGAPLCKPVLAFKVVRFSPTQPETMERIWSATLAFDASPCGTTAGRFEILFSRLKETAPEADFTEAFTWKPHAVEVAVNFWPEEAGEVYGLDKSRGGPCPLGWC